jgi:hypothetical protein
MQTKYWQSKVIILIILSLVASSCDSSSQDEVDRRVSATLTAEAKSGPAMQQVAEEYMEEYGFIPISTGNPDFAVAALAENGEKLAVKTKTDSSGNIIDVEGAVWITPDDEVIVLYLDDSGLPEKIIAQEHVVIYSNYTNSSVDIAIVSPNGSIEVSREVPIEIDKLRSLTNRFATGKVAKLSLQDENWSKDDALEFATIALGVAMCAGTFASGGALTIIFGVGCAGTLYHIWSSQQPEKNVALEGASIGSGAITCATGLAEKNPLSVTECGSLVTHIAELAVESASEANERVDDSIQLADAALEYGTGSVQITLTWDNESDMDLWVTEPDGEIIGWEHPNSDTSGTLDVDDTNGYGPENIFWPYGEAPSGKYKVEVHHFAGSSIANYRVLIQVNSIAETFFGSLAPDERVTIAIFEQ